MFVSTSLRPLGIGMIFFIDFSTLIFSLKSVDLVAMKKLQDKVNIIPIIAKSDTITKAELAKFKTKVMAEIKSNDIRLYQFPTDDDIVSEINENTNVSTTGFCTLLPLNDRESHLR